MAVGSAVSWHRPKIGGARAQPTRRRLTRVPKHATDTDLQAEHAWSDSKLTLHHRWLVHFPVLHRRSDVASMSRSDQSRLPTHSWNRPRASPELSLVRSQGDRSHKTAVYETRPAGEAQCRKIPLPKLMSAISVSHGGAATSCETRPRDACGMLHLDQSGGLQPSAAHATKQQPRGWCVKPLARGSKPNGRRPNRSGIEKRGHRGAPSM